LPYALRNTLVLAGILILVVLLGGYWVFVHQMSEIRKLERISVKEQVRLGELKQKAAVYETVSNALDGAKKRWATMKKIVPSRDDTKVTIDYLNHVLGRRSSLENLKFSFVQEERTPLAHYNLYMMEGEGRFPSLYSFVWKIEHGKPLYKIQSLTLDQIWKETENKKAVPAVKFRMGLRAYFKPELKGVEVSLKEPRRVGRIRHDPFRPLIHAKLPPNVKGLLEVDGAKLLALDETTAFVESRSGKVYSVKLGGEVYLGRLKEISVDQGKATFELNEAGIVREVVLELGLTK